MTKSARAELVFEIANTTAEPALRRFAAGQALPGWVSVRFEREPDYFQSLAVQGDHSQVLIAREQGDDNIVAMHTRTVQDVFVDGIVRKLGYIGQLRVADSLPGGFWRYRRLMRDGFRASRELLRDKDELPYDLTSILAGNRPARRLLEAGLRGLPRYESICGWNTLVLSCARANPISSVVREAVLEDLPSIVRLLNECNARFQFAPVCTEAHFRSQSRCRDLQASDFLVAEVDGELCGCVAIWDQRAFKQTVVASYNSVLRRTRFLHNFFAPLTRFPTLPPVGTTLVEGWLSHFAVRNDDVSLGHELINAAITVSRRRGFTTVMLGLSDQRWEAFQLNNRLRPLTYKSILYLVHWPEDSIELPDSTERDVHVETATL